MTTEKRISALILPDLPRNDDAERAVLGGVLVDPPLLYEVIGKLRSEHFAHPYHEAVFVAIADLAKANRPIDEVSVLTQLGPLSAEITRTFVNGLTYGVPRKSNVSYHAESVINTWKLRRTVLECRDVINAAVKKGADAEQVVEQAQAGFFALSDDRPRKTLWWADEMTSELMREIGQAEDGESITRPPVFVGLPSVDALFDGFSGGDFAVLGGRPSTGKTALANQIGLRTAGEGTVLVCSMEMKHSAVWRRALSNVSKVYLPPHRRRPLSEWEQREIGKGSALLQSLSLAIEDMPNATDMQVLATARRVQLQRGLRLVIVDYLQLMRSSDDRVENRNQELGAITRSLKQIAMQLDVPVLALAALSRAAANERPTMAHIRECGTAEYDADHIFLMHRDVQAQKDLEPGAPSPAELIVEKQRNGATGAIPLLFFGETYRFESQAVA